MKLIYGRIFQAPLFFVIDGNVKICFCATPVALKLKVFPSADITRAFAFVTLSSFGAGHLYRGPLTTL
jgi:hypothetical protein